MKPTPTMKITYETKKPNRTTYAYSVLLASNERRLPRRRPAEPSLDHDERRCEERGSRRVITLQGRQDQRRCVAPRDSGAVPEDAVKRGNLLRRLSLRSRGRGEAEGPRQQGSNSIPSYSSVCKQRLFGFSFVACACGKCGERLKHK